MIPDLPGNKAYTHCPLPSVPCLVPCFYHVLYRHSSELNTKHSQVCIIWLFILTSRSNLNSIPIREPVVTLASRLHVAYPSVLPIVTLALHFCCGCSLTVTCHLHQACLFLTIPASASFAVQGLPGIYKDWGTARPPQFRHVLTGYTSHYLSPNKKSLGKNKLNPDLGWGKNPQQPLSSKLINLSTIFRKNIS